MKINDYKYSEIKVGDIFEFKRRLSTNDIDCYARLTGDLNPLHCDDEYAKTTKFKSRITHGMLAGSLFSTLVGMVCPGKRNLYLAQSLNFKNPIYPDSELTVRGIVKDKIDSVRMVVITTDVLVDGEVMVTGEAKVQLMGDKN